MSNKCSTNDDDEGVSLRPSTSVRDDDAPALMTIRQFKPCGARDDRLTIGSPLYARRGLETIVNATGRTNLNSVALWAIARGLGRFAEWTEIETICAARATLLRCGSADLVQLDEWRYQLAARDGHTRLFLRCVSSADSGRCADRARGLGLSTSTHGARNRGRHRRSVAAGRLAASVGDRVARVSSRTPAACRTRGRTGQARPVTAAPRRRACLVGRHFHGGLTAKSGVGHMDAPCAYTKDLWAQRASERPTGHMATAPASTCPSHGFSPPTGSANFAHRLFTVIGVNARVSSASSNPRILANSRPLKYCSSSGL